MEVFFSLGSNLYNRKQNIINAINIMKNNYGWIIENVSSFYETEPYGNANQNWFYNVVVQVKIIAEPQSILFLCKTIEYFLGRQKSNKWTKRIIDIDILFFNSVIIQTPLLTIPHKCLHKRKFVLIPLMEIVPLKLHPVFQKTIKILLNECEDNLLVRKLKEYNISNFY